MRDTRVLSPSGCFWSNRWRAAETLKSESEPSELESFRLTVIWQAHHRMKVLLISPEVTRILLCIDFNLWYIENDCLQKSYCLFLCLLWGKNGFSTKLGNKKRRSMSQQIKQSDDQSCFCRNNLTTKLSPEIRVKTILQNKTLCT